MAEVLVSAIVTVLVDKLYSAALMSFAQSQGIDSQLKKWKKTLPVIQAVLADAAQKQITQKPVELWLVELQDLAYDIEDVLDDIATEVMKRKLQESRNGSTRSSKVLKMIPSCCTSFIPNNIMYGRNITSKLDEITTRLHDLSEQRQSLGLVVNGETSASYRTNKRLEETSLLPDVSEILGRDGDKEVLLGNLLEDEGSCSHKNVISIVSIVGMGGIGKTTLARLLYNDPKVKGHFELRAWVCVSDDFDVFDITKQIYQAVVGEDKTFTNLDLLQMALKEKLSKQRFLLVLDDVWNEDHKKWETLKQPLVGAPGSKVIVTTRNTVVASVMNSAQPHNLGALSGDIALSLFAQYALEEQNFDKHPSVSTIAQGIVQKCGGLPLALVTIGRVLKTKGMDVVEWEELLKSEIWSSQDESGILPALKLSYYHLPSHLKQLFAYCSLYPKDHLFDKNELVLKWMAQGFLSQPRGDKSMENLGHAYFQELHLRCFFQPSTDVESRYTMHDLMHDLAISVGGKFFFMLDEKVDKNGQNENFEKFRHFSFTGAEYRMFKELHRARCLRTLLRVGYWGSRWDIINAELLTQLRFLRVLSLTDNSITEVPQSIGNLKHLRYLNLSQTNIKNLPKQVGKLYNLQSLLVRHCHQLSSLPDSFAELINLRHLDMVNTSMLKKTPLGIGGSTSLQTLTKIYIEEGNGFKISELKGLSDLQGALSIEGLHKVIHPTEADDANLQLKRGLDNLYMEWSDVFDALRSRTIEYDVLEKLRPPSKLKRLSISFYGGMKFPTWLGDPTSFDRLSELMLSGCENCKYLPTLGNLSSLRELCLRGMKAVHMVGFELLSSTKPLHGNAFPSLESLEVEDMESLEIWSTSIGDDVEAPQLFPSLRAITFRRCPKLGKVSFGLIPLLKDLTVKGCSRKVLKDLVGVSSSIRRLEVGAIKGLTQLDKEVLKHLGAVQALEIQGCHELRCPWELELEACRFFRSLQELYVYNCPKLESIKGEKEGVNIMGSLRKVVLHSCDALESYYCPSSVETLDILTCSSLTSLSFSKLQEEDLPSSSSNLKYLRIGNCNNIKSISKEHLQSLTSLEEIEIYDCPCMEDSFPSRGLLWPPNLKKLMIGELKKPMSEWGLQNYPHSLVELSLHGKNSGVVSFGIIGEEQEHHNNKNTTTISSSCFLLPPSLTYLFIINFEGVESVSEVLQHLPHLQKLNFWNCPKLRDVPMTTSSVTVRMRKW
uniref:putative disease resistance RPP13-like protein 1 n=1 Tax=Erigeron canadensis TaxID=72917 RepID=UPI001CB8B3C3|nr:putative disease resistance RPP13-like protein 1 [Erigeron canadensis]XP_043609287.1 putative disease resistance RPP13-like protein 1 [Erigeron canadensis]